MIHRFGTPIVGVTPYAAVQAQSFRTPGYSEIDANAATPKSWTSRAPSPSS
jgi:hypothetical protein